jgi:ribosome modulation factor
MNEWQYTNPFFLDGAVAAELGESIDSCPYNYLKYDDQKDIQKELYRQEEWLSGFRSVANEKIAG